MPPAHDYSAYIWPAYGLTALIWVVFIATSLAGARRWKARAEQLSGQDERAGK